MDSAEIQVWIEWYNKWYWSTEDFDDERVGDVKNNEQMLKKQKLDYVS